MAQERVRTGIEGLDVLLNDGPVPKRSHVVAGPRGTRVVIPGPALGSWSADRLIRARTKRGSTAAAWRHEALVLALIAVIVAASVASAFMSGNGPAASPPQDRPLASAWSDVFPLTEPPAGRYDHTAVYNPASNRMVVFGGKESALTNSVWVLRNATGLGGAPSWMQLAPTGSVPAARIGHSAVYDAASERMVLFGGRDWSARMNDTWILRNATGQGPPSWTQLSPAGSPPAARATHSAVYDASSDRMIVYGGSDDVASMDDTWVLRNATALGGAPAWVELAPSGGPPLARISHTAVYNPATNRMVVFGGQASPFRNDVWVLSEANGLPIPFVPRIVAIALTVVAMGLLALGTQGGPSHRLLPRRESKAVAAPATHDTAGHR